MSWRCVSLAHIRGEKTLSCWNTPTTATPTHSSISAHTNSTAPEAAARSLGCTLLRLQMITAERIGVVTGKLAQNMLVMLPKSSSGHGRRAVASPRTLRKHCPASAARSFFRRIIWRRFTVTCAGQARCASRTKCRWDSGAWENIFGDSNRRESFRTSWFWASRAETHCRSACPEPRCPERLPAIRIPKNVFPGARIPPALRPRCTPRLPRARDRKPPPDNPAEKRSGRRRWAMFPQCTRRRYGPPPVSARGFRQHDEHILRQLAGHHADTLRGNHLQAEQRAPKASCRGLRGRRICMG